MKLFVVAAVVVGASALVQPAAHASTPDHILGGCVYNIDYQNTSGDMYEGNVGTLSVTATGDGMQVPIGATVTCWIEVNGVVAPGTTHSFGDVPGVTGVQAGKAPVSFTAGEFDRIGTCQSVTFADSTTRSVCYVPNLQMPPQQYIDLLDELGHIADGIDCPVLRQLAGEYPGGVTIGPDGDVYLPDPLGLGLNPWNDCPPYGNF
jgi:hypothetical protein